ncbi:hypothetical protein GGI12_004181 [Dipsacomyces acuminosporus]|nr:hypothetical protein GGI12_004181 [Dipsacomyces acuminosporus]
MVKSTLILGILSACLASAHPVEPTNKAPHEDTGVKLFTPDLKSKTGFIVYDKPVSVIATASPSSNSIPIIADDRIKDGGDKAKANIAAAYFNKKHGIPTENLKIADAYTSEHTGITHVYMKQVVNGLEIVNGVGSVNINRRGKVISSSHSFAPKESVSMFKLANSRFSTRKDDTASIKEAVKSLADYVNTSLDASSLNSMVVSSTSSFAGIAPYLTITNLPKNVAADGSATAKKSLIQNSDGSLTPVWSITLDQHANWWSAEVNAETGKVESINNWVASSESYNVYPRAINDPSEGARQIVDNPADTKASPIGWVIGETTVGNNVWAQDNPTGGNDWQNNHRPKAPGNVFNYELDLTKQPSTYIDAAITQLFYSVNTMHDLSFLYGFTEAAGNFQDTNFSTEGLGGDGVIANAQDGSGKNNANFATPPDGQRPRMRMYIWDRTNPNRDGDLDQGIVAHEYTHGISNRLTGGPSNTNCLNQLESGGMGEGWSDTVANLLHIKPGDDRSKDLTLGEYVFTKNIRNFPYSTNNSTNPTTYNYLDRWAYREVHAVGEVWAEMLYEVIWNLIENNGNKIADLFAHDLTAGNSVALQIILDGMKLQPCNPKFTDARNAIIQADQNLTNGKNRCTIWKGFAKRGLGPNARFNGLWHIEDYGIPYDCRTALN